MKIVGGVLAVFILTAFQAHAVLTPGNLRCDVRVNPLGIGNTTPRLSWELQTTGEERGEIQTAYQVQVGSTPGASDLWDSGKVISRETLDVPYAGAPLTSGQQCFWRVRIYDGNDTVSSWSPTATWSIGLLSSSDWSAAWIGYDAAYDLSPQEAEAKALFNTAGLSWVRHSGQTARNGVRQMALRKKVVLPHGQVITNAVFALYADNECVVYVNGQRMDHTVKRWETTARIVVTPWLQEGTNILALSVTNGDAQESASVIGRLVVQFASGEVTKIAVDTSWKAAQWPTGEWTQASYNDASWATPSSGGTSWGTPSLHDSDLIPASYLRKPFNVEKSVRRATVYVTALGAYELRLNGRKVGDDVLTPGWTQFNKRVYYQTYDVTDMVQGGANVIGAILGDGWFAGNLGFKGARLNYGGRPRFLAQLVLDLADGSKQTVVTDNSWKASYGPIRSGDLLLGCIYDARMEMPGWDQPDFEDSGWALVLTGLSATTGGYSNVTSIVRGLVSNNQLNFVASNATLGGDPAFGIVKFLQITFRLGSSTQTLSFQENTTVNIGGGGQPLAIIEAFYGNPINFPGQGGIAVQAAVAEPARVSDLLPAVKQTLPKPGCYTFDLGQNMVGWVRLKISGNVGDRITVRHGEMLNPDGTVYTANLRGANSTDFYVFGTNGTVVFEPQFTFHGFRYVEVRGLTVPPSLNSVTGVVVRSDMPQTGAFACSNPLVNQLFSNIIWGQKGNYLETPTDCPQRDERLGWTGDTQFFMPTAAYNFDVQAFFRRHMITFCEDAQRADGAYAFVVPDIGAGHGGTAWGDAGYICPLNLYRTYGDTNVIAAHYDSFVRYGQFVAAHANNHVVASLPGDFGDWVNLGGGATSTVMDTAYYAYYAWAMSEMAAAIGKSADAAAYASLHSNIVAAFGNFFNADGSFKDGSSQTGYALAFSLNLVPENLRAKAAQKFAETIAQFGNHLATGFIGTPRLLPALHAVGRDDLAYKLLLQESYPSWLYQVKLGATTMWERWDGWTPEGGFQTIGMNSFNHYAFGAVGEYLYSVVGGIKADSPGYRTIRIEPVPGPGLTWANTRYDSVRGRISTAWTNTGTAFKMDIVIPPNTTARIGVPSTAPNKVTESGVPAASAPGVTFLGHSNNYAFYQVGSGRYSWSSPFSPPAPAEVIITKTNQVGSGTGTFYPGWNFITNGSLIAGRLPTTAVGDFSKEKLGRSVASLTAGGSLGLTQTQGLVPITTSTNYVTCGNGGGAGATLIYSLTGSGLGYDLTNVTVYGGWADRGRDQQAYNVSFATTSDPANFIPLAIVNFNPLIAESVQSATRVTLTSTRGVLATNVVALKFDFTSPSSENGFCGYGGINVFGKASLPPAIPANLNASLQADSAELVMSIGDLVAGRSYKLESTTNLSAVVWLTETNFVAPESTLILSARTTGVLQRFYRLLAD